MHRRTGVVATLLGSLLLTAVVAPTASAAPGPLPVGRTSLQALSHPDHYITSVQDAGRIAPVSGSSSASDKAAATFTLVPGLSAPECYSFQGVDGRFLRHRDFVVRYETNAGTPQFRADATFCAQRDSTAEAATFAPVNYPDRRLRHRDFGLRVDPVETSARFTADSTFRLTSAWTPRTTANPVLPALAADPFIARFGDRYYLYPTSDGAQGWASPYYTAWSSTDLRSWTPHGTIMDLRPDVAWADDSAWAPSVTERGGRYYLYFSGGSTSGDTRKQIGVAVSDSPTGPFRDALGRPLVAAGAAPGQAIDPMVFTDDDGRSYLYWGQGALNTVALNADMTSFDPAAVRTTYPSGYNEGAFVLKRNGTYYLMWSEDDTRSENYRVAYATGPSPTGPWTNRGVVLSKNLSTGIRGTGHHSVVRAPGTDDWYIAYHRFAVPAGDGMNREVAIDRMTFRSDGTINPITPTP